MIERSVIQGNSIVFSLTLRNSKTKAPIDLSTSTAKITIAAADNVIHTAEAIITDPLNGVIYHITPYTLTQLDPRTKLYADVEVILNGEIKKTVAQYAFTIAKGYSNG
jgi:hypothetical protein